MPPRFPTFLQIGASKSGTTSVYRYLEQHPEIFVSRVKEPRFFALEGHPLDFRGPGDDRVREGAVTTLAAYQQLFDGVREQRAIGEASVLYLYHPDAVDSIARRIPDVKLVAVLRNPAERAYSAFLYRIRDGVEPLTSFEEALDAEPRRMAEGWYYGWYYRDIGFYHRQLRRYYDRFDRSRIQVHLYDDLQRDPITMMKAVFGFLGVDDGFRPDVSVHHNPSGFPKHPRVQRWLSARHPVKEALKSVIPEQWGHKVISWLQPKNLIRPPLSQETKARLLDGYREDILRLQDLIGRDLSDWLRV
jgi:hypothetical protein